MSLPFSQAAERNKEAIGDALHELLGAATTVFEFGSGTGQHAAYLCQRFSHLLWQPSEQQTNLETIKLLIDQAGLHNILPPLECDVLQRTLSVASLALPVNEQSGGDEHRRFSFAFSANTAHIMSVPAVARMMSIAAELLEPVGIFALYGPFRYGTAPMAEGNIQFDAMLREQDAEMGVRDKYELDSFAVANGMTPIDDLPMPSNNRILIWQKKEQSKKEQS